MAQRAAYRKASVEGQLQVETPCRPSRAGAGVASAARQVAAIRPGASRVVVIVRIARCAMTFP
jgi:hypothetical protein